MLAVLKYLQKMNYDPKRIFVPTVNTIGNCALDLRNTEYGKVL